jgi:hypothetical protein
MAEGIGWLLEPYAVDCVTFARGIEPAELVARLGARQGQRPRRVTVEEAMDALAAPGVDGVARIGRAGDWCYAVEYGDAVGPTAAGLEAVSGDGAEAVSFRLTPGHPPSMFRYYEDGRHICSFGIGEEIRRWGSDPDLLVPALVEAGVLPVRRGRDSVRLCRSRLLSVLTLQEHFGLRLPRGEVVEGRLPLYLVRER